MQEFINTLAVAVVAEAINNAETIEDLQEVAQGIKASNYGDKTKEVLRLVYSSRKEELKANGGREPSYFKD